jgi:4-amino-4-deoxy-L-arabinose transferase-like glycosyltransferase
MSREQGVGLPHRSVLVALLGAAILLMAVAAQRSAEYDEQYTLFLTGGSTRPVWPETPFTAGRVAALQAGHAGIAAIARDLRTTDVHPPLYFWAVSVWRRLVGPSLFAARLASVLFSVAGLACVAAIARRVRIPPSAAVLLTLGCYGFAYTGAIARGFALAQLLTLMGVAVLLGRDGFATNSPSPCAPSRKGRGRTVFLPCVAGALMGAATFTNYLAAFVPIAALLWIAAKRSASATAMFAWLGFLIWLPADLWFFLAQRQSRTAQFAPFEIGASLARLARYAAANVFGGLPLYAGITAGPLVAAVLAILLVGLIAMVAWRWRHIATPDTRRLLAMATVAPPIGLLLLGAAFNNTPIELRYLAFATPFAGLLLAGAFASLPRPACGLMLAIQALSIIGLMTRPETMQPARATAAAAAALVADGVVLVPRGNDGVGIVGAFAIEAPPSMRLLVVARDQSAEQIRARSAGFSRAVVALLGQDANSRAALPVMRRAFADPCWRAAGEGFHVLAFDRICR